MLATTRADLLLLLLFVGASAVAAAAGQIIGRLAANLSVILQGKDKPVYAPHKDCGDICVVVNAEKAVFTGNKWEGKLYRWHTGTASCRSSSRGSMLHTYSSLAPACTNACCRVTLLQAGQQPARL